MALAIALACGSTLATHAQAQVAKKGVGDYAGIPGAVSNLYATHVGWYYDWGTAPVGDTPGVQFVPMIWGHANVTAKELDAAKACGAGVLLGFNEPNVHPQSNMTVEQAIADWPKLMATGLRLGSPAPGWGDDTDPHGWLARFMAEAKARGYRVDFICLHPYQAEFDAVKATADLKKELEYVHRAYGLPIWVTEYGMVNWNDWNKPGEYPDNATAARFATLSAAMMDKLPYVERYAWFSLIPKQGSLSLTNSDGSLNIVGRAWAAAQGGIASTNRPGGGSAVNHGEDNP